MGFVVTVSCMQITYYPFISIPVAFPLPLPRPLPHVFNHFYFPSAPIPRFHIWEKENVIIVTFFFVAELCVCVFQPMCVRVCMCVVSLSIHSLVGTEVTFWLYCCVCGTSVNMACSWSDCLMTAFFPRLLLLMLGVPFGKSYWFPCG